MGTGVLAMRGRSVVHSSAKHTPGKETTGRDDWRTPMWVLDLVRQVFGGPIQLDPCADSDMLHQFAQRNFTKEDNALMQPVWFDNTTRERQNCFMNAPYSQQLAFNRRLLTELQHLANKSTEAIVLMAARTDTAKWRSLADAEPVLCLVNGRIQFDDPRLEVEHCGVLWPIFAGCCGTCDKPLTSVAGFPSALFYFGSNRERFADIFETIGKIWLPR
jgi:hypothetical protein